MSEAIVELVDQKDAYTEKCFQLLESDPLAFRAEMERWRVAHPDEVLQLWKENRNLKRADLRQLMPADFERVEFSTVRLEPLKWGGQQRVTKRTGFIQPRLGSEAMLETLKNAGANFDWGYMIGDKVCNAPSYLQFHERLFLAKDLAKDPDAFRKRFADKGLANLKGLVAPDVDFSRYTQADFENLALEGAIFPGANIPDAGFQAFLQKKGARFANQYHVQGKPCAGAIYRFSLKEEDKRDLVQLLTSEPQVFKTAREVMHELYGSGPTLKLGPSEGTISNSYGRCKATPEDIQGIELKGYTFDQMQLPSRETGKALEDAKALLTRCELPDSTIYRGATLDDVSQGGVSHAARHPRRDRAPRRPGGGHHKS